MPDGIIATVEQMALEQQQPIVGHGAPLFEWTPGVPIIDDVEEPAIDNENEPIDVSSDEEDEESEDPTDDTQEDEGAESSTDEEYSDGDSGICTTRAPQ
jgi:hypothetical protein